MIPPEARAETIAHLKDLIDRLQRQEIDAIAVIYVGGNKWGMPWLADCNANALRLSGMALQVAVQASQPDAPVVMPLEQMPPGRGN